MKRFYFLYSICMWLSLSIEAMQTQPYVLSYTALAFLQRLYDDDIVGADSVLRADRDPFLVMYTHPVQQNASERIVLCVWYTEQEWQERGGDTSWRGLRTGISFVAGWMVILTGGMALSSQWGYDFGSLIMRAAIGVTTAATLVKLLKYVQHEHHLAWLRMRIPQSVCDQCGITVPVNMVPVMLLATPYTIYDPAKESSITKSHILAASQTHATLDDEQLALYVCSVADIPAEELFYTYMQQHQATCSSCC